MANFNIHIVTQTLENYGDENGPAYWKPKGGQTHVITGFSHPMCDGIGAAAQAVVNAMLPVVECDNAYYREWMIDWSLESVDELTYDEKNQMEYEGRVTFQSPRVSCLAEVKVAA